MKICPSCQRTYADDSLNYCLDDGTLLTFASPSREAETVLMGRPAPTNIGHPMTTAFPNAASTTPFETRPRDKSRTWLWGILILGGLMLLCGGGLGGVFWIASERNNKTS
ncbi:MAG TPA: hypothetical protein VGQ55_03595, partial [Pyrinomonadaceae bacterium]|nr:hypothetical protein [Pyrinomonadaceae bacterium]